MPVTLVATQIVGSGGTEITLAAPNASGSGGNYCLYSEHTVIRVVADGTAATSTTLTIEAAGADGDGNDLGDRTVVLAKSHNVEIPLRPVNRQPDGTVLFNCSATITGLTMAVVQYP